MQKGTYQESTYQGLLTTTYPYILLELCQKPQPLGTQGKVKNPSCHVKGLRSVAVTGDQGFTADCEGPPFRGRERPTADGQLRRPRGETRIGTGVRSAKVVTPDHRAGPGGCDPSRRTPSPRPKRDEKAEVHLWAGMGGKGGEKFHGRP